MPERLKTMDHHHLLRAIIIGECSDGPFHDKVAMGCMIINRINDKHWPNSLHEVLLQKNQFTCTGPRNFKEEMVKIYREKLWWRECDIVSWGIITGYIGDITGGATKFYSTNGNIPDWARGKEPTFEAGNHLYFKMNEGEK